MTTCYLELELDVESHWEMTPVPFTGSPMGAREEPELLIDSVKFRGVEIPLSDHEYELIAEQVKEAERERDAEQQISMGAQG